MADALPIVPMIAATAVRQRSSLGIRQTYSHLTHWKGGRGHALYLHDDRRPLPHRGRR
jgi:hypothetical protein